MPAIGTFGAGSARAFGLSIGREHWIALLGTSNSDRGRGVATDTSGNGYILASTRQSDVPVADMCLAKYHTSGILQWQRLLYGTNNDTPEGIATDSSGNTYVAGYSVSNSTGLDIGIVAKYNTSGVLQWQRQLSSPTVTTYIFSITVDLNQNVYICGLIGNNNGILVAKYNTSGILQWQRKLGTTSIFANSITVDSSGSAYICGISMPAGVPSTFIAKYNTSGTLQWQRTLSNSAGYGVTADTNNNIYICADTNSGNNIQIAKYNTSGILQWQRALTGDSNDAARSITADIFGNIYICGTSTVSGISSIYVAKYTTSGVLQWQRRLLSTSGAIESGYFISTDNKGNFYVSGTANNIGSGNVDAITCKLPGDGSKTGTYLLNGVSLNYINHSLTDSATTLTDAASIFTDTATTLTDAASTLTDGASFLTSIITKI